MTKNSEVAELYKSTIEKYVKKGYIRKVPEDEHSLKPAWYLPHFPVIRMNRETTKVRIVFDASAKCDNISLNDVIFTGPKLQQQLFNVLLRFRKNNIAVVCDVEEMYLRVGINPTDRRYHRFLWNSKANPPEKYEFSSLVFGVNASPFLSQYVSQKNARKHADKYPLAAETVLQSTYMDDSMDSVENEQQGIELYKQLHKLWSLAGMNAKKWLSNSKVVLDKIPIENRAYEIDLSKDELPMVKTLGVLWIAEQDHFTFHYCSPRLESHWTKRSIFKKISNII